MPIIHVWFSCGAASAVAAQKTIELYGNTHEIHIINNPIAEEKDDNQRFLRDVEQWLNVTIEFAVNPKFPQASIKEVWNKEKYMSGPYGASCTRALKVAARQFYENTHPHDFLVMGFDADEKTRADNFRRHERSELLTPLIELGLSKADCFKIITDAGIELPVSYRLGYPNANCPGCVKSESPTYWNHVRRVDPEIFHERAIQSRALNVRLAVVKGERVYLDELDPNAVGRPMKHTLTDCGIFCEMP